MIMPRSKKDFDDNLNVIPSLNKFGVWVGDQKDFGDIFCNQLGEIKKMANPRIDRFIEKKSEAGFQQELEIKKQRNPKCMAKPFRFDVGDYLHFGQGLVSIREEDHFNLSLIKLAHNETLMKIATTYLGVRPILGRFYYWYDFKLDESPVSTQLWHRDGDDILFLKVFIPMNDQTLKNGAHSYCKQSHSLGKNHNIFAGADQQTKFQTFKTVPNLDIWNAVGDDIVTFERKAGSVIIEDTSGLHRGNPIIDGSREMIVLEYMSALSPLSVKYDFGETFNPGSFPLLPQNL